MFNWINPSITQVQELNKEGKPVTNLVFNRGKDLLTLSKISRLHKKTSEIESVVSKKGQEAASA